MSTLEERVSFLEGRLMEQSNTLSDLDHKIEALDGKMDRRFDLLDAKMTR